MNKNVIDLNIKRMIREFNEIIELETPHYDARTRAAAQLDCRAAAAILQTKLQRLHGISPARERLDPDAG